MYSEGNSAAQVASYTAANNENMNMGGVEEGAATGNTDRRG